MHELNGANQWHISIGGDYGLNFASYVGCSVGALRGPGGQHVWPASGFDPGLPDSDSLKLAYEQWWLELVRYKTDCILAGKHPLLHQPPGFETVADLALRQTCAGLWPAFIEWWEMEVGGQTAMRFWEAAPDIYNYINEFEVQTGRSISTFTLRIDLVYGIKEPVKPVHGYLLLPPGYKYLVNKQWWITLLEEYC
ncbi:hypothetical protein MKZ24_24590 [Paenibacillus sp. FSL R7-0297]|uniref:hypothetical protein n=1 Tax=unclassified Paenibacillus TaxID=185978 RepID=UPI0004F6301C|nr:hypothetical protein [Paenibacillus sp. FSL R5-0912]AIQ40989.1 hypothetical protein R50912_13855 [Paenibacillus sp. FSL R5-0912]